MKPSSGVNSHGGGVCGGGGGEGVAEGGAFRCICVVRVL